MSEANPNNKYTIIYYKDHLGQVAIKHLKRLSDQERYERRMLDDQKIPRT